MKICCENGNLIYESKTVKKQKKHMELPINLKNSLSMIYGIIVENRILQNWQESCDIGWKFKFM